MRRAQMSAALATEHDLKPAIVQALRAAGFWTLSNAQRGRAARAGLGEGSPDIVVLMPPLGTLLALEVKRPKQKQRPAQAAWQARFEAIGGAYYVVTSKQEAIDAALGLRARGHRIAQVFTRYGMAEGTA